MIRKQTGLILFYFFSATCLAQPAPPGTVSSSSTTHSLREVYSVPRTEVKNQYLSSTCWSFASNSFLESELMRMGRKPEDLSEMFTARESWWHKIRLHLSLKGSNCFTPGGQFHDVQRVLREQGLVPESVFPGKKNAFGYHDHGILDSALTRYVRVLLAKGQNDLKRVDSLWVDSVLDRHLGRKPEHFRVEGQSYTPQSWLSGHLGIRPDDYLEITSYSHHPYYRDFVFENKYNFSGGRYLNLPWDDFNAIVENALRNGYSLLWNGDVTHEGFQFGKGVAFLQPQSADRVKWRQQSFEDSSSYMDHMMHLVGLYRDDRGQNWYYLKNSWGKPGSELDGYLLMDENYFAVMTAALVVHREAIPESIRKRFREP